jgi:hypothetical protein
MHQRGPVLVHEPSNRLLAVAPRQMLGQIPSHRVLTESPQAEPLPAHPVGEVRDAAKIGAPGAYRVAARLQVLPVSGNVRLENALLQPRVRVRLQWQTVIHHDLPSHDYSRAEDRENYAQVYPCNAGESAQAARQLRIIRTCT